MIVSNSSPLISLSKLNLLHLLKTLYKEVYIPEEVFSETVLAANNEEHEGCYLIKNAINEGWLKVKKCKIEKSLSNFKELGKGELGAISLARELNAKLILLDDSSGRYIANKIFSLNVKGTIYILLLALEKGLLSRYHVRDNISTLVRKGFRLSIEFYSQLMRLIPPFDTEIEDHFIMHTFGEK